MNLPFTLLNSNKELIAKIAIIIIGKNLNRIYLFYATMLQKNIDYKKH